MAVIGLFWTPRAPERGPLWGVRNFFFQSCFFTLSDMFMTRINHKIDKNHPNNIFFPFLPNLYQILSEKGSKRAPPSASGHFWEFFRFFCANHLRNTFSSLYQQAGKIGKNVHFIDIPNTKSLRKVYYIILSKYTHYKHKRCSVRNRKKGEMNMYTHKKTWNKWFLIE